MCVVHTFPRILTIIMFELKSLPSYRRRVQVTGLPAAAILLSAEAKNSLREVGHCEMVVSAIIIIARHQWELFV